MARDRYDEGRERMAHMDLQNPSNVRCSEDGVAAVVDWEQFGWVDRLYDIALVESAYVDRPAEHWDDLDPATARARFRSRLDVPARHEPIVDCYKVWPAYLSLELTTAFDVTPSGERTARSETAFWRARLRELDAAVPG